MPVQREGIKSTAIQSPTDDAANHTTVLRQLKECIEIAQRLRGDVGDSYVRVSELVAAKLIRLVGGTVQPPNTEDLPGDAVPSTRAVNTTQSLAGGGDLSADRTLSLVNDENTPDPDQYYGTDPSGARGWFDLPAASSASPLTTVGDLWGYDGIDARVPVGADGDVLTADSGEALGVKWATPSGGSGSSDLIFAQTRVNTADEVVNSAAQTTFFNKYTIPANTLANEGHTVEARYYGVLSTDASVGPTIRFRVKLGSTTVLDSGAVTLTTSLANVGWSIDATFIRTSNSNTLECQGRLHIGGMSSLPMANTAAISVTLSSDQIAQLTVEWGTADADNTVKLRATTIRIDEAANVSATSGVTDPNFGNVSCLMHFEGSNGSSTFTDEKGHTFIRNNSNPTISTTEFQWGASSLRLPGTGIVRSNASEPDFGLGTGDYTIEFWLRFDSNGGTQFIYDMRPLASGSGPLICTISGTWNIFIAGGFNISGGTAPNTTWTHVALTRASGTTRFFVNGTQVGSNFTDSTDYTSSQYITMGAPADSPTSLFFTGYIDDLRLTKGVARYTANFTAPAATFPDA